MLYQYIKNQQDALFNSQFISIINLYMYRAVLLLVIMKYGDTSANEWPC